MAVLYVVFIILVVGFIYLCRNYKKGNFTVRQKRRKKEELAVVLWVLVIFAEYLVFDIDANKLSPPTLLVVIWVLSGLAGFISHNLIIHLLPEKMILTIEGRQFWENWGGYNRGVYPLDTQMTPLAKRLDRIVTVGYSGFAIASILILLF